MTIKVLKKGTPTENAKPQSIFCPLFIDDFWVANK